MPEIDFDGRRAWLADFLSDPAHETSVAEARAEPVGFVTSEADYLHQLVVAPAAKGGGTAVRLLDTAKARAGDVLCLDVNQANERAVRFYIREGFQIEAESVNPASGLPTWRMRWRYVPAVGATRDPS